MPFLAPFAVPLILGGSSVAAAAIARGGSSGTSQSELQNQLDPLIAVQKQIAESVGKTGQQDIASARGGYDYVNTFLKQIMEGKSEDLMKYVDASGATKNIDENAQILSELGVRGSRRAAALGQSYFDRDAAINNFIKQLRVAAPQQLAQLYQAYGNLGIGQLSAAVGAGGQASNTIFNAAQLGQQEEDRRAALLSNIFSTVGSVAGIIAGGK